MPKYIGYNFTGTANSTVVTSALNDGVTDKKYNSGVWSIGGSGKYSVIGKRKQGNWLTTTRNDVDNYFNNTTLLLHFDGTDASTTFTDDSNSEKTITAVGNAAISTAQKRFGTGALAVDGTGDYVSAPYSTDWDFGTDDFTIELFYRPDSTVGQHQGLISCAGSTAQNGWTVGYFYTSNKFYLQFYDVGGAGLVQIPTPNFRDYISDNTWAHIAISRQGTAFRTFVDGALVSTTTSSYSPKPSVNGLLKVGAAVNNGWSIVEYAKGYIDEARVTRGVARYTSAFTAPTTAFPNNGPD